MIFKKHNNITDYVYWELTLTVNSIFGLKMKNGKAIPVQACYMLRGFQEVEGPRFKGTWHIIVVRLALYTDRL
jgi:hypothetical protein